MKKKLRLLTVLLTVAALLLSAMSTTVFAASKAVPTKPQLVSASVNKPTNKVTVKWKKAKNVTQYNVCYKEQGKSKWTCIAKVASNKTSYVHDPLKSKYKLKAGKKYVYTVRPYNKASKKYGPFDTKGKTITVPNTMQPKLASVSAKMSDTERKVIFKWNKALNATRYNVLYKEQGAKSWTVIAKVTGTSYTHKSSDKYPLKGGKTYVYTVRPYNGSLKKYGPYDAKGLSVTLPAKSPSEPVRPSDIEVESITLNEKLVNMTVGETIQLKAEVLPGSATDKSVRWTSDNTSVITVDQKGTVRAVGSGLGTVKATSNDNPDVSASCPIIVEAGVTGITLNKTSVTLKPGESVQLTAAVSPSGAANSGVEWWSSSPTVVSVDDNGLITAANQATGTTSVTITAQSRADATISAKCEVRVQPDIDKWVQEVIELTNKERAKYGLEPLEYDLLIQKGAMIRAQELSTKFSHERPNGKSFATIAAEVGTKNISRENIASGFKNPEAAVQGWMNSSGHRAAILSKDTTRIGIGIYPSPSGTIYWVQLFGIPESDTGIVWS